jgi:hypothetical protein
MGIVLALFTAGALSTWVGWRYTFGLLVLLAAGIYKVSDKLNPVKRRSNVSIDWAGVVLAILAVFLISVGANNITHWGLLLAGPGAPFNVVDMSPAPIMIVCGIFLVQAFFVWSRKRRTSGRTSLIALEVLETPKERSAVFSMFAIGALGSAITFLIPLYLQIVQGRSGLQTAVAVVPFSLASFTSAVLVIRLYGRLSPRHIARYAFLVVSAGAALLGVVIRNDWSTFMVIVSMTMAGLGEGALVTLLFNVLVTASPKELAGDVGSLRGTTNNLAAGVGTALASALVVGVLGTSVHRELVHNPAIPNELKMEVNLDNVSFITNDQLRRTLARTSATPEQVDEAVRIITDARLVSLKVSFSPSLAWLCWRSFPPGDCRATFVERFQAATPRLQGKAGDNQLNTERGLPPQHSDLSLRVRHEQIHSQPLGQELGDQLPLYAVARIVERRSKCSQSALSRRDGDDPAADPALARQANVVKPVARGLI